MEDLDSDESRNLASRDRLRVDDAVTLLDYALSIGSTVSKETVATIRSAEQSVVAQQSEAFDMGTFETARRDLAKLLYPVTAASLRATARPSNGTRSEAERWSRVLWYWTLGAVALVLVSEGLSILTGTFVPVDAQTDAELFADATSWRTAVAGVIPMLQPFLYGLFGACAYLLRRCHEVIHTRTFDPLRRSEYMNRMLLGLVSGGAVGLFAADLMDSEIARSLGAPTLAFLAGYSTDFVFTAVERLVAAVLPKVEPQEVPPSPPVKPEPTGSETQ